MFIIVAGVGTIGGQVIKSLIAHKHNVVGIDIDEDACNHIHNELGAVAVKGNATDLKILKEAGVDKADVLLCLMRNDSDNIACSLMGKSFQIPQIVACLRKPSYEQAYECAHVTSLVKLPDLMLTQIIQEVEQPDIKKIKEIGKGKAGVYTITIPEKSKIIGKKIKEISQSGKFPKECLIIGILRHETEDFIIPKGNNTFQEKDTVFLVAKQKLIKKVSHYLKK